VAVPMAAAIKASIIAEIQTNGFLDSSTLDGSRTFRGTLTGPWMEFIDAFTRDWTESWQKWQDGHKALTAENIVTIISNAIGTGVGGGVTQQVPIDFIIRWPYRRHPRFLEFERILVQELRRLFLEWSQSYKVNTPIPYEGTSSHTPITPGTFNVENIPVVLGVVGQGINPINLRARVEDELEKLGWNTRVRVYRTGQFLDATQVALTKHFAEWLESTRIIGDTAIGPAAAGSGAGVGVSLNTGKLVG
jgi:hypothetical protein